MAELGKEVRKRILPSRDLGPIVPDGEVGPPGPAVGTVFTFAQIPPRGPLPPPALRDVEKATDVEDVNALCK